MSCNQSPKAAHHSTRSNASSARLPLSSRGAIRGASRHSVAAAERVSGSQSDPWWGRAVAQRIASGERLRRHRSGVEGRSTTWSRRSPRGPSAARDAERVRTRLLNQVDERRNPRTKATVNQLLDRWLEVAEMETTTRNSVVGRLDRHVRSVLGAVSVSRLDAETLESLYAQLRRCRDRCGARPQAGHTCRPLAPATVRLIHANLSAALSSAVRFPMVPPPR